MDEASRRMIIDFHTHILPGIDDGSKSTEMSIEMLKREKAQGVDKILLTSHFYADRMRMGSFLDRRDEAFDKISGVAHDMGIELQKGAEVAFFPGIGRAEGIEKLVIEGTDLMLLEMPFRRWDDTDIAEVEHLIRRGIVPIIAHIERFFRYQRSKGIIEDLMDMDVLVQVNAECLLGGWAERRLAINLFKHEWAHFLGSDCHNLETRRPNLGEGRQVLAEKLGQDVLKKIDNLGNEVLGG